MNRESGRLGVRAVNVEVHMVYGLDHLATQENETMQFGPLALATGGLRRVSKPLVRIFSDVVAGARVVIDAEDVTQTLHVDGIRKLAGEARKGADILERVLVNETEDLDVILEERTRLSRLKRTGDRD